jgi:hypothetical protein
MFIEARLLAREVYMSLGNHVSWLAMLAKSMGTGGTAPGLKPMKKIVDITDLDRNAQGVNRGIYRRTHPDIFAN